MKPRFRSLARYIRLSSGLSGGIFLATTALGDTTWTGGASQDWSNLANWTNGVPLDASNNGSTFVNTPTGNFPIYSAGTTQTDFDVFVGNGNSNSGRLDQSAGTLAVGNGNWLFVGASGGNGTYNMTGDANLNAGAVNVGAWGSPGATGVLNMNSSGTINATAGQRGGFVGDASVLVGENGSSGTLNVQNGTVNALVAAQFGVGAGSTGNLNISGGAFNVTGNMTMGRDGSGTASVTGGSMSVSNELWVGQSSGYQFSQSAGSVSSTSYFVVGRENGSNGTYDLTGGTVNAATGSGFAVIGSFGGSTGSLNVSGGTFNTANNAQLLVGEGGTGTLTVSGTGLVTVNHATEGLRVGAGGGGNGTVNLNGGTIQASLVTKGGGTGNFNFNGGTLKATTASATYLQGLTRANVRNGGAVIDSNGVNVTIAQPLLHSDLPGDAAVDGGLIKNGTGALTLSGVSTYTGATTVNSGSLVVNGSISTSVLTTVKTGAMLSGTGMTGDLTILSGGTLAPGNSPGTLSVGDTDLQLGSTLAIELNSTTAGSGYDQLNVTGTATLAGMLSLTSSFTPAYGNLFFILVNDDTDAITGTFTGLANNDILTSGGQSFQISYFGNSGSNSFTGGNDVALMAVPEPAAALLGSLGVLALLRRRRNF